MPTGLCTSVAATGRPHEMRFTIIALVLCACVWAASADVAHIKAAKAKIIGRLAGKHHKRGIFSGVPPFKLGHDIPLVTHSVLKPLVVTYPPTAAVAAVKIPVPSPHAPHYPVPVGHKVPGLPHPHYGLKFPHTKFVAKPDHHFHHHHHHVAPRPVVPVIPAPIPATPVTHAAPVFPAPQPTIAVAQPIPAPSTPVAVPARVPLPAPAHIPIFPQNHLHLRPLLPAAAVSIPQSPVLSAAPVLPYAQQFPYVIRPGGAVQTSVFATYPRYPFINSYQAPILPFGHAAPAVPQVLLERPHAHQYLVPHADAHNGVIEQHTHNIAIDQTPTILHPTQVAPQPGVHLQPTQDTLPEHNFHFHPSQVIPQPSVHLQPTQPSVPLEHDGWSPVAAHPHDLNPHEGHFPQQTHHFTQEQGNQVYEHHTDEQQYHDFQHQIQQHIQHQIEQAQYEQSLQNNQPQPAQEYGVPQQLGQEYGQPNEYSQQGQDFGQHQQDFSQNGQDFAQHNQDFGQHEYNLAHLGQEYGLPQQGVEGRSSDENEQQFHNHIPLNLQPPIDRPLDHFR